MSETDSNKPMALLDTGACFDPTLGLVAEIVSAFISHNEVNAEGLQALIRQTHDTIINLGKPGAEPAAAEIEKPTPAQIRKSITPDALISFVDGRSYKTLKRHLGVHGLEPHSYRDRYGLPSDYPMVAPNYAAQRSALAKSIGLGVPGGRAPAPEPAGSSLAA